MRRFFALIFLVFLTFSTIKAQTGDVTVSLNEQFFDALLEAVFTNLKQPSFPLAGLKENDLNPDQAKMAAMRTFYRQAGMRTFYRQAGWNKNENLFYFDETFPLGKLKAKPGDQNCDESIRLQREIDGVRTAVRFRDGKIYAPIAFSGSYNPPLIGCIDFQGWAESNIDLEFDNQTQTLVGRATVNSVNLSGTGGVGSGLIAKMVQSSMDKKINPIKILDLEKVSFVVPVQNNGSLRLKATGIRHEIGNGVLNVHITYQFLKG
ncbi:MAG: hypothetical protein R2747_03220 [Pyrinomonadaceae bacterium]